MINTHYTLISYRFSMKIEHCWLLIEYFFKSTILVHVPSYTKKSKPFNRFALVRVEGLEPPCLAASDPKSDTSTNFATPA